MTSQINTQLAPMLIDERLRSARYQRSQRAHTYAMPVVHEIPRPVERNSLTATGW